MTQTNASKKNSEPKGNPLNALAGTLQDGLAEVNKAILERMVSDVPLIPELANHLIAAGGKRIRPVLTLASAGLFDYDGDRQYKLAACVEFIHTATLLHDDVVDASDQRRGKDSANAIFGNEAAVLVGDFLFSRSFQLMVEDGSLEVLRILSSASAVIAEGEVMQLSFVNDLSVTEDEYYKMIRSKTAALFAAACEVGAVVAGRSEAECEAMREYGYSLGIAFQISDDVLDYTADETKLGKSVGDDFKEGKMTLPVIKAIAKANDEERAFWQRCLVDMDQQEGDLEQAQKLMQKHHCLEESLAEASKFAEEGSVFLDKVAYANHDIALAMRELLFFAANREY